MKHGITVRIAACHVLSPFMVVNRGILRLRRVRHGPMSLSAGTSVTSRGPTAAGR